MTHGAEADQHTLYLCRYRMCKDMWHKPIYCNKCAEDEGTHMHKFHYPADDIGVQAYLRDRLNPDNEEQYEEISQQSLDTKGRCQHEREDEDEDQYYAEIFNLQIHQYQNPLTEEDDMELRRKSLRARFSQWQQRKYEGKKDP